jgi:hypothetical protein
MNHLTDSQIVDAAEGHSGTALATHVAECAICAARVHDLRGVLEAVTRVAAPEPSPLFWNQFSARVNAALDETSEPARAWLSTGTLAWLGAAAVVVMSVIGFYGTRTMSRTDAPPSAATLAETAGALDSPGAMSEVGDVTNAIEDDDAWALMRSLAGDLHYDDARAAGVLPSPDSVESAATELPPAERAELVRLLQSEMKRMGA